MTIAPSLFERIEPFLRSCADLVNACNARSAAGDQDSDRYERFEQTRQELMQSMPDAASAWEGLRKFWPPVIAVLSRSVQVRESGQYLRRLADQISEYHEGGSWISQILGVLDNEPILVIEPKTRIGILARISGVVDNFQLNALIMDAFPKSWFLAPRRVSRRAAKIARGEGPQQPNDTVVGVWNLYTWAAIHPGYKLPVAGDQSSSENWIWNEGKPDDIPIFNGRRVILLGPRSYPRFWMSQRTFSALRANLEIERQLSANELDEWLNGFLAEKNSSLTSADKPAKPPLNSTDSPA